MANGVSTSAVAIGVAAVIIRPIPVQIIPVAIAVARADVNSDAGTTPPPRTPFSLGRAGRDGDEPKGRAAADVSRYFIAFLLEGRRVPTRHRGSTRRAGRVPAATTSPQA